MVFINNLQWLWLVHDKKISSNITSKLLDVFKTIENIYNAKKEDYINLPFLDNEKINLLINKDLEKCKSYLNDLASLNAGIITYDDEFFPEKLKRVKNFPYLLYYRGNKINLNNYALISVVGSRSPDAFGKNATYSIAEVLALEGFLLVSGGAKGVDSVCHVASINKNSPPICVIGTGVDEVYPKENRELFNKIIKYGMIISEYPLGTKPLRFHFPKRNKIISGLSFATIVTQASEKSGSLITADFSKKIGNTIFSLPGAFSDSHFDGSISLIKNGATPIYDKHTALDYIKENLKEEFKDKLYKIKDKNKEHIIIEEKNQNEDILSKNYDLYKGLNKEELLVINSLKEKGLKIDEISKKTSINLDELNMILLDLELSSFIKKDVLGVKYELNN